MLIFLEYYLLADVFFSLCLSPQHFQNAAQQLMRMEDPKFFVRVYGLVLTMPPVLVMEKAQYGSLASFFKKRQSNQPIKPFHLLNAASQMAQGMLYLVSTLKSTVLNLNHW